MIRANNQAAVTALIQQLHHPLQKILYLEYSTIALITVLIIIYALVAMSLPLGIYHILWMGVEWIIGLVYRKILTAFSLEIVNEYLNEKAWLREGKQKVVALRYIKFLCLLFNILGMMQAKQSINVQSIAYFSLCLSHIPLTLLVLIQTKEIQVLFNKINRVMSNFDIDFQQDKQEYLNEMSNQQSKQVGK